MADETAETAAPPPVRSLLVIDDDTAYRMGRLVRHLCVGMIDESVQISILSRSDSRHVHESVGPTSLAILPKSFWPWSKPNPQMALAAIGGQAPDVVHCMSPTLARATQFWCDAWHVPLLVQISDARDVERFLSLTPTPTTFGLCMSQRVYAEIQRRAPGLRHRVWVVPPGMPARQEPLALDNAEHIPSVIFTAPVTAGCGLDPVLKALPLVVTEFPDLQFFILSTGRAEGYYRKMVKDLKLRSWVTFAGQMIDAATQLKATLSSDYFISPAGRQRYMVDGLIALTGGLIILAPNDAQEDYFIHGETAHRYDPNDPKKLAASWLELLRTPHDARRLAENALEYARAHHQASMMVQGTAELYRQLQAQPHQPMLASKAT